MSAWHGPTAGTPTPEARAAARVAEKNAVPVGMPSALWVLIAGFIGFAASFTLTVEKIDMLIDPHYQPSCNFNPILACGSVMGTQQASVFGFPNPLMGVVAFTIVIVTGVLSVGRVRLPRWYWSGLLAGLAMGVVFVHWLIFQSLYRINALCPYCMVVWSITIPLFVVVASITLRPLAGNPVARVLYQWRWPLVALWVTAVILAILVRFWYFWTTLI
ncbi:hypothetical protein BST26_06055 [Mycolicibacterium insubricum]|uniref:Vitamin K epoxide reductase domain-containing protein n=2 Tax=Mycolicibacterium insubricum TaxID=444597 RepID=A0A1X0DIQ6_9MYCO|nr:hypothetical protein BST26_06055 [Mycolicibacterium insubricum]